MKLKNCMEEAVADMLDDVIKDMDICKCERCRYDIAAIALNHLPPRYVVTEEGEIYARTNELAVQFAADIISEIIRAVEVVSKYPNHEVKNGKE